MAKKNRAAVALGKRRMALISPEERAALGRKGGTAKTKRPKGLAALSIKRRKAIARKAAQVRAENARKRKAEASEDGLQIE